MLHLISKLKMSRGSLWPILVLLLDMFVFRPIQSVNPFISENSSERQELFNMYTTFGERWANTAYNYLHNLDCSMVFFTTNRECRSLVNVKKSQMNIHIAEPSPFGWKYRATLPDESLTRADSHDAVLVVDPYPQANYGHLVIVFYVDLGYSYLECRRDDGLYIGNNECMKLALRRRCKNALERRSRRKNFARRCEINFLPVVQLKTSEHFIMKKPNYLTCISNIPGFGVCPELRTLNETSELICNPIRDNTQRCSTTHETVRTSCRVFEICDQAVLLSGGWNRETTGLRYKRNLDLFYWMLRQNGFKRRNIKIFYANGARGMQVPGESDHQVHPAAMKLALRYHLRTLCSSRHCVDSLVLYMNSPAKNDGTSLLWDVNNDGIAEESERYTISELKDDLSRCLANQVHVIVDQSYAGEIAQAFRNSSDHQNVIVFGSSKDHEYAFDDEYTSHWAQANHERECSKQVHEHTLNDIKSSSPVIQEGQQGFVKTTIFGAPCDVTPPLTQRELSDKYYGCQNLPTAVWLGHLFKGVSRRRK